MSFEFNGYDDDGDDDDDDDDDDDGDDVKTSGEQRKIDII